MHALGGLVLAPRAVLVAVHMVDPLVLLAEQGRGDHPIGLLGALLHVQLGQLSIVQGGLIVGADHPVVVAEAATVGAYIDTKHLAR